MLKTYDEIYTENGFGISKERSLWEIARELNRRNDLLEVEMLCKTAEQLRGTGKSAMGKLHYAAYNLAEELTVEAHKRISKICGISETSYKEEDDDETEGE